MSFKEGCEEEQFLLKEQYVHLLCCLHLKNILMNILHTDDELPLISFYMLYIYAIYSLFFYYYYYNRLSNHK